MSLPHAVQIRNVEKLTVIQCALARLIILVSLQTVDPNVLLIQSAHQILHVSMRDAKILVPAHVEIMLHVESQTIDQFVNATTNILVILSLDASPFHVRVIFQSNLAWSSILI